MKIEQESFFPPAFAEAATRRQARMSTPAAPSISNAGRSNAWRQPKPALHMLDPTRLSVWLSNGQVLYLHMASLQLYSSYNELKYDRVERPLTQKEKLRQEKAVQSLSKIKKVARA